jgi:hypothetical protein
MTGNKSESIRIGLEKFVKSHQVTLFLAGFSYLKPLCGRVVQYHILAKKKSRQTETACSCSAHGLKIRKTGIT